jgi:hypothetical protein
MAGGLVRPTSRRWAARPGVEASIDSRTATVEPAVGVLAAAIEASIEAITATIEMPRHTFATCRIGSVGGPIQPTIHAIAAHVEPLLDAISTAIEPSFDAVAPVGVHRTRGAEFISRRRTGGKERDQPQCHYSLSHGKLLLALLKSSTPRTPRRPPRLTPRGLCQRDRVCIFLKSAPPPAGELGLPLPLWQLAPQRVRPWPRIAS